jgi:hypothetical protein
MTWALFAVAVMACVGLNALLLAVRTARPAGRLVNVGTTTLRCSLCGVDWPHDLKHYGLCPACLEPTHAVAGYGLCPLDVTDARSMMLHYEFDRFYAARERARAA